MIKMEDECCTNSGQIPISAETTKNSGLTTQSIKSRIDFPFIVLLNKDQENQVLFNLPFQINNTYRSKSRLTKIAVNFKLNPRESFYSLVN